MHRGHSESALLLKTLAYTFFKSTSVQSRPYLSWGNQQTQSCPTKKAKNPYSLSFLLLYLFLLFLFLFCRPSPYFPLCLSSTFWQNQDSDIFLMSIKTVLIWDTWKFSWCLIFCENLLSGKRVGEKSYVVTSYGNHSPSYVLSWRIYYSTYSDRIFFIPLNCSSFFYDFLLANDTLYFCRAIVEVYGL